MYKIVKSSFFFFLVKQCLCKRLLRHTVLSQKDIVVSVPVEMTVEFTMSTLTEDSQMFSPLFSLFLIKCTDHLLSIVDVIHRNLWLCIMSCYIKV